MSRLFNGSSDFITFSAGGAAALQNGAWSVIYRIKIGSSHRGGLYDGRASGTRRFGINPFDSGSGTVFLAVAGVGTVSVSYASLINEWGVLGFTKPAGSAQVRAHMFTDSGGTWSHTDIGNVPGNGSGTVDTIFLGSFDSGQFLNATVAAAGKWAGTALADLTIEGLTTALAAWKTATPSVLWAFNQASTSDPVNDIMASGANQSAITGTSVSASEPPGWSYSLGITQALGTVVETDSAVGLGRRKTRALGVVAETDVAQPLGRRKTRLLGVATTIDLAQPIARRKTRALGVATEADLAIPLGRLKRRTLGVALEVDEARPLGGYPVTIEQPGVLVASGHLAATLTAGGTVATLIASGRP